MRPAGASGRRTPHDYNHLAPLFDEFSELEEGDPRREELREKLITGHLPIAEHIAQRFSGRGTPIEDLLQVATVGLINAVDRFQPERGSAFLAFAVPTVMGEVRRYFRDVCWSIRVPRRLKELHLVVSAASNELGQRLGRAPTPGELAEHLQISKHEVYQGIEAGQAYSASSLDEPVGGQVQDDLPLGETIGQDDSAFAGIEDSATLQPLIKELPARERRILALRFLHNMTQTQIAEQVGISQMHVSRLLSRTLQELRDKLAHAEGQLQNDNSASANSLSGDRAGDRSEPETSRNGCSGIFAAAEPTAVRRPAARVRRR